MKAVNMIIRTAIPRTIRIIKSTGNAATSSMATTGKRMYEACSEFLYTVTIGDGDSTGV